MIFKVEDMSCGHCTAAIEKAIKEADANAHVECDLSNRTVTVGNTDDAQMITNAIKTAGYEAIPA